jgi:hypothetical protein
VNRTLRDRLGKKRIASAERHADNSSRNASLGRAARDHFDTPTPSTAPARVAVYAIYARVLIQGSFDPVNASLTIAEGPGQGHYKSPSGACAAVLRVLHPDIASIRPGSSKTTSPTSPKPAAWDTLPNDIYSHVADKINARLLRSLQTRWKRSLPGNWECLIVSSVP